MPPIPFRSTVAVEGVPTSDRRIIDPGALSWRDLPLSLMAIIEDSHGGMPMTKTVNVGRFDTMAREKAADLGTGCNRIVSTGVFDDADPIATEIARKVGEKYLRGISIDVGDVESELEVIEEDEDGWPTDWLERLTKGTIGMATICGFPAFAACSIELTDPDALAAAAAAPGPDGITVPAGQGDAWRVIGFALTAAGGPELPPRTWFDDPGLDGPTALTISDDGRVVGHVALWGTSHVALPHMTPPRSPSGYAHFHVGVTRTDGGDLATGVLTLGTGHAPTRGLSPVAAAAHYDNVCTAWADVRAGEDEWGIWIAGGVRPGLTAEQERQARSAPLSGDWRKIAGEWEMIAALSVNTPGFPVPRPALTASGEEEVALVAAGALAVVRQGGHVPMGDRIAASVEASISRALAPLKPLLAAQRREAARAKMGRPT